jgi:Cysteine-rich CWC
MSEPALDPAHCPLCAQPNECGAAAARETCWCFEATLAPAALARIPERALGAVCICASCGRGEVPSARG